MINRPFSNLQKIVYVYFAFFYHFDHFTVKKILFSGMEIVHFEKTMNIAQVYIIILHLN